MKSNQGGRPDDWRKHSNGDRMTADELKHVPPVVNLHRSLQVPRQKQQHKTSTEPPDAA
jgi:hypothetical protein